MSFWKKEPTMCPYCGGTGREEYITHTSPRSGTDYTSLRNCRTCDGIGAVVTKKVWVPKSSHECDRCDGRGYNEERVGTKFYPSGVAYKWKTKRIRCKRCGGKGKQYIKAHYRTDCTPDESMRNST